MKPDRKLISQWRTGLAETPRQNLDLAIDRIVQAKMRGGSVVVVTGSGPNIHEGVTTLIAGLIHAKIVDGVITSSAVVAHEMAGTLDKVKRIRIDRRSELEIPVKLLPRGDVFEITQLPPAQRVEIEDELNAGWELYERMAARNGEIIIKAAGNMAWPMGIRTERLAREAQTLAQQLGVTLEYVAGLGADAMTMIGAGSSENVPVLVSIPQLVGGGAVGLAIGDAVCITRRARLVADLLARADVIVESAIALSQEIHDGPFETYTGHGIWSGWEHVPTFSLAGKMLVRIDLDPNLELAWKHERRDSEVQRAVDQGLPKTKLTGIPFRMEMSGFARLEGSIPITADIGAAWPILASALEDALGVHLDFISAPQETESGRHMREWIVEHITPVNRQKMFGQAELLSHQPQASSAARIPKVPLSR